MMEILPVIDGKIYLFMVATTEAGTGVRLNGVRGFLAMLLFPRFCTHHPVWWIFYVTITSIFFNLLTINFQLIKLQMRNKYRFIKVDIQIFVLN